MKEKDTKYGRVVKIYKVSKIILVNDTHGQEKCTVKSQTNG